MLVTCFCVGTKYSDDYVLKLRNGVMRHAPEGTEFGCFTDRVIDGVQCWDVPAHLPGWWSKVYAFSLGIPLINIDLDTIIVGDMTPLLEWDGFGIIDDWNLPGYNSSVMKLTGTETHVWDQFHLGVMGMMRGDQDWLNVILPDQRTFPPHWVPSFKADRALDAPPDGAIAVNFHGFPKCHQVGGWVKDHWV
jgi:hypothetical protein